MGGCGYNDLVSLADQGIAQWCFLGVLPLWNTYLTCKLHGWQVEWLFKLFEFAGKVHWAFKGRPPEQPRSPDANKNEDDFFFPYEVV